MRRLVGPAVLALLGGPLAVASAAPAPAALAATPAAATPAHTLRVSGEGVASYPAFAPDIDRYGVTTTAATGGTLTVTATTADPAGRVLVDGRPAPGGTATVTGLVEGDEVSVWIEDSAGTERHTLVYLPAGFPAMDVAVDGPGVTPGGVLLTLSRFTAGGPRFETIVDHRGVPTFVRSAVNALDFKMLPDGHFSVSEGTTTAGRSGESLVELDDAMRRVGSVETVGGLTQTDGHDSVTLADGGHYLLSYDHKAGTTVTDAVIQQVAADGTELWRWDSGDFGPSHRSLLGETVNRPDFQAFPGDYAHVNSIDVMADGNLLVSFRHLSAVLKIARTATGGFAEGEVMWKLGGRDSSFTFAEGEGGPCAQHSASELPNGDILVYDNGSDGFYAPRMCLDPADRGGPLVARPFTRVTDWRLTPPVGGQPGTALAVADHDVAYGIFAGNAQRLASGNTMVGWGAPPTDVIAEEIQPDGGVVWQLRVPTVPGAAAYTTYRAVKHVVPDRVAPQVRVARPAEGAHLVEGQVVTLDFTCTDRGGSGLRTCAGPVQSGGRLDTSTPGAHSYAVTASDGAGGVTVLRRTYVVRPIARPDAQVRALPSGTWVGADRLAPQQQRIRRTLRPGSSSVRNQVALQNDGVAADRLVVRGTAGDGRFSVRYLARGVDVTRRVVAGTYRTGRLAPRATAYLLVVVGRRGGARVGDARTVSLGAASATVPARRDSVGIVVTARR